MGFFKSVTRIVKKAAKVITPFLRMNPKLAILAIAATWLFGSLLRKQDNPDFGDTEFDNFEKGILVNKQSNDATIPVGYGTRLVGGTRVFVETTGTDNTHLYICLVLCEGEINGITEIRVDDKVVTFTGAMADNTQRTVATSDSNFYKDSTSHITIEPHIVVMDKVHQVYYLNYQAGDQIINYQELLILLLNLNGIKIYLVVFQEFKQKYKVKK